MLATSGIYEIKCLANGRRYIGQAQDMRKRCWTHRGLLRRGKHWNRNLQASWNKYGSEQFEFTTVLVARQSDLALYEQAVADFHRSTGLFNWGEHLDNGKRGRKLGKKARARIKAAVNAPEARLKKSESMRLAFSDPAARARLSAGCERAWKNNEVRRRRVSTAISGARNDPTRSKAWNAALKAAHNTPAFLAKVTGRRNTPETIAKMAEARRTYWANKRAAAGSVEVPRPC